MASMASVAVTSGLLHEGLLVVESAEDQKSREPLADGQGVEVDDAGEEDGDDLSGGHHRREEEGSELLDGVVDHQLTGRGADRERQRGDVEVGILKTERESGPKLAGDHEHRQANGCGAEVDVEHLVVGGHLVSSEELLLQHAREAIAEQVTAHEEQAVHAVRLVDASLI